MSTNSLALGVVEALQRAGSAVVSDVFDKLGRRPLTLCNDLQPTLGWGRSFAGPAYTLDGIFQSGSRKADTDKLRAIDEMTPGVVAVFAGAGMRGVCWFGDLLATAMKCRGVAGVIVDGGVRDWAFLQKLDLPMLVGYRTPTQAIGRWKLQSCLRPVRLRGALEDWVTVNPGDIIVADDDGAVSIPRELADEVGSLALDWEAKDQNARHDIMNGMKLMDALKKHGAL